MLFSKEYHVVIFSVFARRLSIIAIMSTANPMTNGFHNKSKFIKVSRLTKRYKFFDKKERVLFL